MSSSFLQSTGSASAGAGFNIVFEHILMAIVDVSKKNSIFNSTFQRLEQTLRSMAPAIRKIDSYNRDFDRPEEIDGLKAILKKGAELVAKSAKIKRYDVVRKPMYSRKLLKLEDNLKRYNTTVLQLHQVADGKEILFEVKQLSNQVRQMSMGAAAAGYGYSGGSFGAVGGGFSAPMLKVVPVGLEIPLTELKKKVVNDGVPFLVLSAPGGCGKTTLATAFCHDPEVQVRYKDNLIFITVSKAANLLTIGQNIFQRLRRRVPGFQSEEDAVNKIECLLKDMDGEPTLLVLDDVWSGSEVLLDRLKFKITNFQILVTSRDEFKAFGSTYKLQTLSDTDATDLFRQSAFPQERDSYEPDQEVMEKIVKSCKGFPLLISVVGKSLLRKPAVEWRKRAKECSKTASFLENSQVLDCLQKSVDALDDKQSIKECYMDLGLFPEDRRIPATALIDMWVELHGLDEDFAISNLYELSFRNLVDLRVIRKDASEDDDGFHNEDFVTQHDLLRDLAIIQSNTHSFQLRQRLFVEITGNSFPSWWTESTEKVFKAKLLAVTTDENFSSSWPDINAPEVEVLVLNFKTQNYGLPKFIARMQNLKVLIVTNHGLSPADLSEIYHLASLPNLKRIRLERTLIPPDFLPSIASGTLQKLSLFMCSLGQAFSNVILQPNPFPNLEAIDIDYCSDLMEVPSWFFNLVQLKKLSITNCQNLSVLPEELGNLMTLEVLRLSSCIELSELPESIGNLQELKILDISDCASVKKLPEQIGDLCNLKKLYMIECDRCEIPVSVAQLCNLKEVVGDEETANSWEIYKTYIPGLNITKHKNVSLDWLH
ncbi:unnamed protein product [Linum tenue]|uniref:RPW8 domain-containing protein n=1 Tax=Linum tenue TaxID=586396 RepID=A0AAV0GR31_9ROSI|nr:unnamed protein product [Linum tenue]